ncbi:hypothetical protein [Streptomyces sp. H39-C1]|uniref:hypothetical protein n=1 Tax=Streptomyces sp. H39-C1 TaxID=3004355 RepID=UPI0022AFE613|nr:hypothetical protein [Streptomyces sp. H39-C1]MCZ4101035.1 hypothetical protein [Streptomyces sp. H39-C1]
MPKFAAPPASAASFLLTIPQGHAARLLLSYTAALSLSSPDAQLLAVVIAVRAARGGTGRISGAGLRALRLHDADRAVADLRDLGWQIPDLLLDQDADLVTVPALAVRPEDHPLPLGESPRARVSGWTLRTLADPLVTPMPPAARLAALFLAGHASAHLNGALPDDLPHACLDHLPDLVAGGFLTELDGDRYRLDSSLRHLAGRLPHQADPDDSPPRQGQWKVRKRDRTTPSQWKRWKLRARPEVRQNAEAVEHCAVCRFPRARVASAFTTTGKDPRPEHDAYDAWNKTHPHHGLQAAQVTAVFRTRHGHGPSYGQLCSTLGWPRTLRATIVQRLLADGWLTEIPSVPWTLRPGDTAAAHGILLRATAQESAPAE